MILVIDNYDSFTYNLVQYLQELDQEVVVFKNDLVTIEEIAVLKPAGILISPGPGTPLESGISLDVIKKLADKFPILGVCLGHQCIGHVYGGDVVKASEIVHGKTSVVRHDGNGIYKNIPGMTFEATRYHSLIIKKETLPASLVISAWTENEMGDVGEIMGVRHVSLPIEGVQYHPESVLSQHGHQLLRSFLDNCC